MTEFNTFSNPSQPIIPLDLNSFTSQGAELSPDYSLPDTLRHNPPGSEFAHYSDWIGDYDTTMKQFSATYTSFIERFSELGDNAHDARAKQFSISVRVSGEEPILCFTDDGYGMMPEIMQMRFFQARNITREQRGHNTLGANGVGAKGALYGLGDKVDVISKPNGAPDCFVIGRNHQGLIRWDCPVSKLLNPSHGELYRQVKALWDSYGPQADSGTLIMVRSLRKGFQHSYSLPENTTHFRDKVASGLGLVYDRLLSDKFGITVCNEIVTPADLTKGGNHLKDHDQEFEIIHPETGEKVEFVTQLWQFPTRIKDDHNRLIYWRNIRFIGSGIRSVFRTKINNQQEFEKIQLHVFVKDNADGLLNIQTNKTVDGSKQAHKLFQAEIRSRYKAAFDEIAPTGKKDSEEESLQKAVAHGGEVKDAALTQVVKGFTGFALDGGVEDFTKPPPKKLGGAATQYDKPDKEYEPKDTPFELKIEYAYLDHLRPVEFAKRILRGNRLEVSMAINLRDPLNQEIFTAKVKYVKGKLATQRRNELLRLLLLEEDDGCEKLEKCWAQE
jgi:hypothetical protein